MSDERFPPRQPVGYIQVTDAEVRVQKEALAETEQLIEDLEHIAAHPEIVQNGLREDLIRAAAHLIASLVG